MAKAPVSSAFHSDDHTGGAVPGCSLDPALGTVGRGSPPDTDHDLRVAIYTDEFADDPHAAY
uniref:hypothetical protein n=1 Tax=Nocardia higoensis TaxID=228599 RepID=UPI001C3F1532